MEIKYIFTVFCITVKGTIAVNVRINTKIVLYDGFFIIFKVVSRRSRSVSGRAAQDLYEEWRSLQKNAKKRRGRYFAEEKIHLFPGKIIFLILVVPTRPRLIKLEEYRKFLVQRRLPGRPGSFGNIDMKTSQKKDRSRKQNIVEGKAIVCLQ